MLKNILRYRKRFSSLQPLRKRGEVLKKAGENEVGRDAGPKRKANENKLFVTEKKAEKSFK